jgi:hypothetical protein
MKNPPIIAVTWLVIALFAASVDARQRQTETQLNGRIPGSTIDGKMADGGRGFVVTYHPDGRLSGKSGSARDEGRWEIVSDQICFQWSQWREAKRICVFLEKDGDGRYSSFFEDGTASASRRYTR